MHTTQVLPDLSPKNPVVFCHGLLGFDSVTIGPAIAPLDVTYWRGIKEVLQSNGVDVLITRVPATSSPIDRALVLAKRISEVYPGKKIHLIGSLSSILCRDGLCIYTQALVRPAGHSMVSFHSCDGPVILGLIFHKGGLDCRYLTTRLVDRNFSVLSVTTIATPHRGSTFADYFIDTVGQARLPQVLALLDLLPNGGGDGKAFEFLTVENMKKFNENTPDIKGVQYFSYGAEYDPGLIDTWKCGSPSHSCLLPVDGLIEYQVSSFGGVGEGGAERRIGFRHVRSLGDYTPPVINLVSSHPEKQGTYLGTLEHVNHLDLVGWINTARYKWAELMGNEIKFKPATFYLGVVDHLARAVEELKPEDKTAERGRGDQDAKPGHGEIMDAVPHGPARGETKQAPATAEEGLTGFPSTTELAGQGKHVGLSTTSGPGELATTPGSHDEATDGPLLPAVGVLTSAPTVPGSHTSLSKPQSQESGANPPHARNRAMTTIIAPIKDE